MMTSLHISEIQDTATGPMKGDMKREKNSLILAGKINFKGESEY